MTDITGSIILLEVYDKNKAAIENPKWRINDGRLEEPHYIHDWERYVPELLKYCWPDLHKHAKSAIFMIAEPLADAEEYD